MSTLAEVSVGLERSRIQLRSLADCVATASDPDEIKEATERIRLARPTWQG